VETLNQQLDHTNESLVEAIDREKDLKQLISELNVELETMALKLKDALEKQDEMQINFEEFEMYKQFYDEHIKSRDDENGEEELDDEYLLLHGFDRNGDPIYYD
jgi:cell fate (sporulation/competence/biofilm development) regulator YlbF (YheA/YmcA/DUF963 family)